MTVDGSAEPEADADPTSSRIKAGNGPRTPMANLLKALGLGVQPRRTGVGGHNHSSQTPTVYERRPALRFPLVVTVPHRRAAQARTDRPDFQTAATAFMGDKFIFSTEERHHQRLADRQPQRPLRADNSAGRGPIYKRPSHR